MLAHHDDLLKILISHQLPAVNMSMFNHNGQWQSPWLLNIESHDSAVPRPGKWAIFANLMCTGKRVDQLRYRVIYVKHIIKNLFVFKVAPPSKLISDFKKNT
jgi:hypothetical protein